MEILVRTAIRSLWLNKARSFLTMLGIIIGISAVLIMVSLAEGAQLEVEAQIARLGSNLLDIRARRTSISGAKGAMNSTPRLTNADRIAIKKHIPEVVAAGTAMGINSQVVWGNANWNTWVQGSDSDMLVVLERKTTAGRLFSEREARVAAKVALLGQSVARELFGSVNPLGATVRVNNVPLKIIGILEPKGQNLRGDDMDDLLIVPIKTAKRRLLGSTSLHLQRIHKIVVKVDSRQNMNWVQGQAISLLNQRYRIRHNSISPFVVRDLSQLRKIQAETTQVFKSLLTGVAAVSLLVGGIGVMNVMLVTVTERTREIGLRMAVGATPQNIRNQFLVESVVLCLLGALGGISISYVVVIILTHGFGWTMPLPLATTGLSVLGTTAIGLIFGLYPAHKAASLDPIEALRFE